MRLLLDTFVGTHSQKLVVFLVSFSGSFHLLSLVVDLRSLALQSDGRHQSLNLWCLEGRLLALLLGWDFTSDNVLAHIIFFAQVL